MRREFTLQLYDRIELGKAPPVYTPMLPTFGSLEIVDPAFHNHSRHLPCPVPGCDWNWVKP